LDSLHNILVEAGLINLVNGLRVPPVPTATLQIGYTSAFVVYIVPQDIGNYFLNRFVADTNPYAISTHTEAIAIASDDLLCYNADRTQLLKLMNLVFDASLILFVQISLRKGQVVAVFHIIIDKIRGQRQSDKEFTRKKYTAFTKFDPTLEIGVSISVLDNLQVAVEFATGIQYTEEEKKTKLNELIFSDTRLVLQTSLIDSISRQYSYEEMVTQLVFVMGLLPYELQTTQNVKMNSLDEKKSDDSGKKINYCWKFQTGECSHKSCRFVHKKDPNRKDFKDKSGQKTDKKLATSDKVEGKVEKTPFKVYLSEKDRKIFGKPSGNITPTNPQG
jgi:hypothetical protein